MEQSRCYRHRPLPPYRDFEGWPHSEVALQGALSVAPTLAHSLIHLESLLDGADTAKDVGVGSHTHVQHLIWQPPLSCTGTVHSPLYSSRMHLNGCMERRLGIYVTASHRGCFLLFFVVLFCFFFP